MDKYHHFDCLTGSVEVVVVVVGVVVMVNDHAECVCSVVLLLMVGMNGARR